MPRMLLALAAVLCAILALADAATAAPPPAGMLLQLAPPNGCYSTTAGGGCAAFGGGLFMNGADALAVSDDGRNVYAGGDNGGGVAFALGAGGALTQVGSSYDGETAYATSGAGLFGANRDTGSDNGGVVALRRQADGTLLAVNSVTDGCPTGSARCATNNNGLYDVEGIAVSPDGTHVYAAAQFGGGGTTGGAVTAFSRNPATQAIAELQCVPRDTSTTGLCSSGATDGLGGAEAVAVSPDGKFLYAAGYLDGAIDGFNLVQSGPDAGKLGSLVNCLWSGSTTFDCAQTPGTGGPKALAISPDGHDLYVASWSGGVTALRRDTVSGVLSFNECLTQAGGGGCTADASFVAGARGVAVSPDGRYVYVSGGGALTGYVIAYARNATTGALTHVGCVTNLSAPGCTTAAGLANAEHVAVAPDGAHAYVTSFQGGDGNGALAAFAIEAPPTCQGASVTVTAGTSATVPLTCSDPNGDPVARAIASGPSKGAIQRIDDAAGAATYVAPLAAGTDSFQFTGSDGTNVSAPAAVTVTVAPAAAHSHPAPLPPRSRIVGLARTVKASRLKGFHGTASAGGGVKRVEISLVRVSGGAHIAAASCKALWARGTFKALRLTRHGRRCTVSGWLRAKGTTRWSFALKHRLAPGGYVLTSRAVAKDGRVERSFSTRLGNRRTFTVRAG